CTETIDTHHAVISSMGERFCFYRLLPVDAQAQARRALSHVGQEATMRRELAATVASLFAQLTLPTEQPTLDANDEARLIALATRRAGSRWRRWPPSVAARWSATPGAGRSRWSRLPSLLAAWRSCSRGC